MIHENIGVPFNIKVLKILQIITSDSLDIVAAIGHATVSFAL